ncbi:DUF4153 domain-containing protein [Bacillus marasmi]|uniref:DUF4153 domain-containing protein n=1 Tax=Bacillus marasmi TaxID=1926279 RepID=UPI0011C9934B|nr:DUF4173 domain-containing protein [Bacillus marasmi]
MELKLTKTDWIFFILCLLLGVTAEESFFRGEVGISYIVFTAVFYGVFFWRFRGFPFSHQRFGYLLLICIWILGISFFIHDNQFFNVLNVLVIPSLVIFQLILMTSQKTIKWNKATFLLYIFSRLVQSIKYNLRFASTLSKIIKQSVNEDKYVLWKKIAIGLIISAPVLFVIISLLMSADSQFERMMGDIPKLFEIINMEDFMRFVIVLIYTFVFFGLLQVIFQKQISAIINDKKTTLNIDAVISITVLILINIVYILFTIVQFKYFFSGSLQGDLTYAEYARKGFFELLFATLINLSITVLILQFVKPASLFIKRFIQVLLTTLILSSGVMLVSAFIRLNLYEEAYGFTLIRVLAHSFMIFLVLIYLYTLFKIWIEKLSLFHFYFISSLLYYTGMNLIDVEKFVVEKNLNRYDQTGKIDHIYLNSLSYSGILGLIELHEKNSNIPEVKQILLERKEQFSNDDFSWQSYNLKREYVLDRLKTINIKE